MVRVEGISISDSVVGSIAVGDRVAVVAGSASMVYVIVVQVISLRHSKRRADRASIRLSFQRNGRRGRAMCQI